MLIKNNIRINCVPVALVIMAIAYIALAIIGAIRFYSPVQRWDMWTAYLEFYLRVFQGDWSAWFTQHNEHRLFFSKLFFWLDIRYFGGEGLFLITMNFLLVGCLWLMLCLIARKLLLKHQESKIAVMTAALLAIVCFSALQIVTFIWGFAIQNYLVLVLPLLAFIACAYARSTFFNGSFWLAVLFSIFSTGAMANGLLVMPLLAVMTRLLRQPWYRTLILVLGSIIISMLYLHGYDSSQTQGTVSNTLLTRPGYFTEFLVIYLGAPFYGIFKSYVVAAIAGILFLGISIFCTIRWFQYKTDQPLVLVLVIFLWFIIGTAAATTIGRGIYDLRSAVESRYMINLLTGWSALGILWAYYYHQSNYAGYIFLIISFIVPLILLPAQMKVFHSVANSFKHQQLMAALALELNVDDSKAIANTYPYLDIVRPIANTARQQHLSIFADPLLQELRERIGQPLDIVSAHTCKGVIAQMVLVDNKLPAYKISGGLIGVSHIKLPQRIFIIDSQKKIVGVALTGAPYENKDLSGFEGYVIGRTSQNMLTLICS